MENYLTGNFEHSDYRVLGKDLFYIRIRSNYGHHIPGKEIDEDHLNTMEKYSLESGAEKIVLKP